MNSLDNAVPIAGKPAGPCALVIFGAAGDLTRRKLIPALYNLARQRLLPDAFATVGFARHAYDDGSFRDYLCAQTATCTGDEYDTVVSDWIASRIHYVLGNFDDAAAFTKLAARLDEVEREHATGGNVLFYFATAPEYFAEIANRLAAANLLREDRGWRRVIVEKPFGVDLASARALNASLGRVLRESQIYRIDHYLGKETVQNLMVLRFGNGIFEPVWNRRYIDHVQITVAETLGVEKRGNYYDKAGALRDMVPNHVFQLISLVAMEPPISFQADAVRDEQAKVMRAVQPMTPSDVVTRVVRGQYAAGNVAGRALPDYRGEVDVDPKSNTETYVALELRIDSWRWSEVPFYVRVGKAMPAHLTEIAIQFKRPPLVLFKSAGIADLEPNVLVINIQPHEGIALSIGAKVPGSILRIDEVDMDFEYADYFGARPATGYERLLYDAMLGDPTLFQRADMVEASWSAVQPILDAWRAQVPEHLPNYHAGTVGPIEADELLARAGRKWRAVAH
jgi:glucose-6-phosphate 1-dehydrogenase